MTQPPSNLKAKRFERQQKDMRNKLAYYGSAVALGGVVALMYKNRKITKNIDSLFDIVQSLIESGDATLNVLELMHNTN